MTSISPGHRKTRTLRGILSRGHLRLVLFAIALASVSLIVSGLYTLRGYAAENVILSARTLAYSIEPALVFEDREAARELVDQIGTMQSLALVEVSDASGKPFVRWQRHGVEDFATTSGVARIMWLGPVRQDIEFRGQKLGSVVVTGSLDSIIQYALSGLVIALCCLGITVIATRMLARQLQESIAGPFDRVAEIAHEASNERRLSSRLDPTGVVEIDRFASDFNALIAELESWHATLTSENAELSRRADHDPLTGLGNRARFERMLEGAIKVAAKTGRNVALLYLDCDGFKMINDRHGHDVGDAVIWAIAERLRRCIREKDRVFRLGGDEFAVVLDNLTSLDAVTQVAERIGRSMDEPINVALGVEHRLALSIGVATYPEDGDTPRLLVRVADQRMYRVKRGEKMNDGRES